jgi:transposase-like protein
MSTTTTKQPNPTCPQCSCKYTAKKGKRRNRLQTLQVYRCTECLHRFTGEPGKNKTYPLRLILETVSTFDLGHSLTETQQFMRGRFHRQINERTISSWLTEYRPLTTYSRLRAAARKLYSPQLIIRSHTFHHQQVYRFQVHRAKLDLLMQPPPQPDTVAKIIIYESGKGKTNGNWPDLQEGLYALIRANDEIGDRIWGELLPPRLPAELEHTTRERTIGVAPAHSEKFAYVRVTDDDLELVARYLTICALT